LLSRYRCCFSLMGFFGVPLSLYVYASETEVNCPPSYRRRR
ncbi:hypothetical protein H5410_011910, partial [Solanum commersonii]